MGQGNRTQRQLDSTQLGQGNQTQIPYMGKDHIWDSTQWDKETGPKPKTIYGIQDSGTRKPDPKTIGFNTIGTGKPDPKTIWAKTIYGIQHSWDRETGPKDHGQRPYMGFNTVGQGNRTQRQLDLTQGTGKPDPKTIYGQRPYMEFNKVGQGNRTQRP